MAFALETDTVIEAIRTTIGTTLTVGSATVQVRSKPETDLYVFPRNGRFPMMAIEVEEDDSPGDSEDDPIKSQGVEVTVSLHFIARDADVQEYGFSSQLTFVRQGSEAISEKIGATTKGALGTEICTHGEYQGAGRDVATKALLRAEHMTSFSCRWMFRYEAERPT